MKHSIVLFLSTIWIDDSNDSKVDNFKHTRYTNILENQEVDCVQTNESAVRYIQARLEKQGESISKIYLLASKEVKKVGAFLYQGKKYSWSHIDVFKERLIDEIGLSKNQFCEIDYDENQTVNQNMDTLLGMAHLIRNDHSVEEAGTIHFDMTGGLRTVTQMLSSLLYLLKHSNIPVGYVLYSDFRKRIVENVSELFDINTLVSGMEEFANYGSTRSLQEYFKAETSGIEKISKECMELLESMKAFSIAVSLCIPYEMIKTIKVLKQAIEQFKLAPALSVKEEAFKYTINTVEKEYDSLLTNADQELKLKLKIIHWCIDKNLLQQALTLSTEWLPTILFDEKIYYHPNLEVLRPSLEKNTKKLKRTLKEEFIMSYRKNVSLLESKSSETYNEELGAITLTDRIQILRQNIAIVKKKKDLDKLLNGLLIKENKLYILVDECIKAKDSLNKMVVKKVVEKYGRLKKVKDLSYIKNIEQFQEKYSFVNTYLKKAYKKSAQNQDNYPTYSRFLYQQSQNLGKLLNCILSSFSNEELIDEFLVSPNDKKVSLETVDNLIQKKDDMVALFYNMLKNKYAYTDLPLEEGLAFIVEYQSIRKLRNTINHASEEQQLISSKDIISRIKNLISAVETKRWDNIKVIHELKEIIDVSKETVGKSNK